MNHFCLDGSSEFDGMLERVGLHIFLCLRFWSVHHRHEIRQMALVAEVCNDGGYYISERH
jgi:hypothetical protein